jgi:hypothetical protein
VRKLADEAGVRDVRTFSAQWQLLMLGSIVEAGEGEAEAAQRARDIGILLIQREGLDSADAGARIQPR